jgi:2-C-methyl-D-erythritol 4-phosphate cytidylyltransferase
MGASVNKVLLPLAGLPVLALTLDRFESHTSVGRIVVVAAADELEAVRRIISGLDAAKVAAVVPGGATRHASEWNGLRALAPDIESCVVRIVLVHDAARPFVTAGEIDRVIAAARAGRAAIPTIAVDASELMGVSERGELEESPPGLHAVQTPQGFDGRLILDAHRLAAEDGFTGVDTASVAEHAGHRVRVVEGTRVNFKITTADDLVLAELVLAGAVADLDMLQV